MNLTETMFKQEEHDVECGDARPARKQYLGIANDETNEITESRDQDEDKVSFDYFLLCECVDELFASHELFLSLAQVRGWNGAARRNDNSQ